MKTTSRTLVELKNIQKTFSNSRGHLVACADINLAVRQGVSFGLVGESGSGKSTLTRIMQHILPATSGEIWMNGVEVTRLPARKLKHYRRNIQAVAQDPYGSLFPHFTVGQNISEPFKIFRSGDKLNLQNQVLELMDLVGLSSEYYYSYPHELSGGQQQRVAIARALALKPELLILDEAVSSLDVSIQAQILNLLQTMKEELNLTYVFISHNLAVIRLLCEETAVMYLGRIVESGDSDELFRKPIHPYTRALIASIPTFTEEGVNPLPVNSILTGENPSSTNLPLGCSYQMRCPYVTEICRQQKPVLQKLDNGHFVECHHAESLP